MKQLGKWLGNAFDTSYSGFLPFDAALSVAGHLMGYRKKYGTAYELPHGKLVVPDEMVYEIMPWLSRMETNGADYQKKRPSVVTSVSYQALCQVLHPGSSGTIRRR
jgi:hypothetical protein